MSALPSNLALVAEDLARATQLDARKSRRRRRLATYAIAFALLALTATAVSAGWLFGGETPVIRVVPSLGAAGSPGTAAPGDPNASANDVAKSEGAHRAAKPSSFAAPPLGQPDGAAPSALLSGLGSEERMLTTVPTTSGGVCLTLTGFPTQCVPTFAKGQHAVWFFRAVPQNPTVVWGIVTGEVVAVDVMAADGSTTAAETGHGGFYAELPDGAPALLVLHLSDGSVDSVAPLPCPLTTPDCDS